MAWETRNGRGRYYTRSRRAGSRVTREYLGCGELAELAAMLDQQDRAERDARQNMDRRARDELAAHDAPIQALHAEVDLLIRGALLVAGLHQHHGEWRRARG